jgi:hypothetical protein
MEEYIEESLATGAVHPSASPTGAGFFFVNKDKTLCLCIDYQRLNAITVKNRYPLTFLSSAFEPLQGATTYHLVRVCEGGEWNTPFNTASRHYEYQVMPFGLNN